MKTRITTLIITIIALNGNTCASYKSQGDTTIISTVITGSYNTNQTSCDFVSEKKFDPDGNVAGCRFDQTCEGNVRTSDFIPFYDKDFHAKCENPVEELPIEEEPTPEPTPGISNSF